MQNTPISGIVLSYQSNVYTVSLDGQHFQCVLKGMIKKSGADVLVGDRVLLDNLDAANMTGRIIQTRPRENVLLRPKIANVTRALMVCSIDNPPWSFEQVDRYLTQIQMAGIAPALCISKVDLAKSAADLAAIRDLYESLGVSTATTSIKTPESIQALFRQMQGQTVVLAGPSGVGKSSLLNALKPDLALAVKAISDKAKRGQHTTRHVALIRLDENTYVADTPGFSLLKFDTVLPQDVERVFPDFAPYRGQCRFDNCLHQDEADCAVKANLQYIAPSRYASYLAFLEEAKAHEAHQQASSQKQEYGYKTLKKGKKEDVQILKLQEKHRETSRRTRKQEIPDWLPEDEALLLPGDATLEE